MTARAAADVHPNPGIFMKPLLLTRLLAVAVTAAALSFVRAGAAPGSDQVFAALVRANDDQIEAGLQAPEGRGRFGGRAAGARTMTLAAAFSTAESRFHHDARLPEIMRGLVDQLARTQNPSGLWDSGNLDSPPDSAFVLKTLARAQHFLERDGSAATAELRRELKQLILDTAEGVRTGGVHTPNHRWAVCSALAHVHHLYPDRRYVERIDQWLAEGIDVDEDGLWAERSSNYTSDVNNPAMVDLAILLGRPHLLEAVRRSLDASYYFFEPDGEVDTISSRRQDQRPGSRKHAWEYYYPYRYLAIHDANGRYAAITRWIERDALEELGKDATNMSSPLTSMLMFPELRRALPVAAGLEDSFAKVFSKNSIARIRRGTVSATVFGGSDWYKGLGHGSGLSTNPTFFKMRKGAAVLESVRMTPNFFSTGFFYSQGLVAKGDTYTLSQKLDVPYHQPLPPEHRRSDGQYALQADMATEGVLGRFFSKMDFADRPKQFVSLNSRVVVTEKDGAFELAFEVDGPPGVGITIELAFRSGGSLTGTTSADGEDGFRSAASARSRGGPISNEELENVFLLKDGFGSYAVGDDRIRFGPGTYARPPGRMEGESLTWVRGSMRAEGDRVYLTGVTPFRHVLRFE